MPNGDGMQQGVQQVASVQEDKTALAAAVDQGQGSVVCGRFKPGPDGGDIEQNERGSPSKMTRQVLGDSAFVGWYPTCQPKHRWQQAKSCAHPLGGRAGHPSVTAAILVTGRVMQKRMSLQELIGQHGMLCGGFHRWSGKDKVVCAK